MPKRVRFQFTLLGLLGIVLASAAVLGLLRLASRYPAIFLPAVFLILLLVLFLPPARLSTLFPGNRSTARGPLLVLALVIAVIFILWMTLERFL